MDFYILKKNNELTAIPADECDCKTYLASGYSYVSKIAACTEKAALKKQKNEQVKVLRWPLLFAVILVSCALGLFFLT